MQSSLASLIIAVFERNSVEYTLRIFSLSATQFTLKKSDCKWFAMTDRDCFCSANYKHCTQFHTGKTILENLTGEPDATIIK